MTLTEPIDIEIRLTEQRWTQVAKGATKRRAEQGTLAWS